MISLSVDTDVAADEDLFGKVVSDLQENIVIGKSSITGTLNYVDDYTGFSSDVSLQEGNYLVIHCTADIPDAVITVEVVNGTSGPRTLDADGIIVLRIADKMSQTIKVVATDPSGIYDSAEKEYSLTGLTCLDS